MDLSSWISPLRGLNHSQQLPNITSNAILLLEGLKSLPKLLIILVLTACGAAAGDGPLPLTIGDDPVQGTIFGEAWQVKSAGVEERQDAIDGTPTFRFYLYQQNFSDPCSPGGDLSTAYIEFEAPRELGDHDPSASGRLVSFKFGSSAESTDQAIVRIDEIGSVIDGGLAARNGENQVDGVFSAILCD